MPKGQIVLSSGSLERRNRRNKHGGGLIISINNQFTINKKNQLSFIVISYMDALALQGSANNTEFNVVCIYKASSVTIHEFTNTFSITVEF